MQKNQGLYGVDIEKEEEEGLSTEEYAFYEALVADTIGIEEMKDATLIAIAIVLTDIIKKNGTIDWDKNESARAAMKKIVKRVLRKYKYPPKKTDGAVNIALKQAEFMSAEI